MKAINENIDTWNLLVKLRDTTNDDSIKSKCEMYLRQINTSAGIHVKKEANVFLQICKVLPVKYETGATSHAVNDLILFTETTRELAELRDSIYTMMWQYDLMGNPAEWDNIQFDKLLNKARATYANELGGNNSLHIINMKDAEKEEYRRLYMSDFDNWKSEHGYK